MKKLLLLLSLFVSIVHSRADDLTVIITNTSGGASTGAIDLTVSGGMAPYTFSWKGSNGVNASTEDIKNLSAGTYTVTVTDKYCGVASLTVNVTTATRITAVDQNAFVVVSPNPTDNLLTIHFNIPVQKVSIRLINVNGKTIQQKEDLNGADFNLEVADLSSGIYFIEMLQNGITLRTKFIKN